MIFGDKVRHVLEHKNMSQSKLAELLGITRQSVTSLLKQKKPHQKTVDSVADALDLDPGYFSDENEDQIVIDEFLRLRGFNYPKSKENNANTTPNLDYNVRTALRSKGITIGKFAKILGTTSENLISILSQDNPSYQTIKKVADALNVNAEELMAYATTIDDDFVEDFNEKGMELIKFDEGSLVSVEMSPSDRLISFIEEMEYESGKVFAADIELYDSIIKGKYKGANLSDRDLSKIALIFPTLNMDWVRDGKGSMLLEYEKNEVEILRQEGYNYIISGEFIGNTGPSDVIVTPLIDKWYTRTYKAQIGEKYFLKDHPRHVIILDSDIIASHNYGPYRSFEVVDGEIPNNPKESIANGSIVTGRKINHFDLNFKSNIRKYDDLIIVTNKGIFINRAVTNALKESLTLKPTINKDGSEQYGQFNMKHILEVWHVIAVTRYQK